MKFRNNRLVRFALIILGVVGVIAVGLFLWANLSPRPTPAGQPPLVRLHPQNFHLLIERFNARNADQRVLVMLSPS